MSGIIRYVVFCDTVFSAFIPDVAFSASSFFVGE